MRVFVLNTGRAGSTTFTKACEHLTNYTAGHERNAARIGLEHRLEYPDQHIEIDNRLAWFLPQLGRRYRNDDVLWAHLTRDRDAVVQSFIGRWDVGRSNITRAYGHGILIKRSDYSEERRSDVCAMYVDHVTDTVINFLDGRAHMTIRLENIDADFAEFLKRIGAEGDLDAAVGEWGTAHAAAPPDGWHV